MNSLPRYQKSEPGRFDFRIPDGLGHYVFPDWDDPDLKVELRDAMGTLQLTATIVSAPALIQDDDYDETSFPEGGPFVAVENVDLSGFALGAAEARVYAKVDGAPVLPCPTVLTAFEVVADLEIGPLYSTVERVRAEVPGVWPGDVTDLLVAMAIAEAGRMIDARLCVSYDVPFPGYNEEPSTPALVESICRRLAARQCLEWMGRLNAAGEAGPDKKAMEDLERLAPDDGEAPVTRLPGWRGPLPLYRGDLFREDLAEVDDYLL
jgi:hypothetical protein